MSDEWSRYYRLASLHDLEVLHARFVEHRFARHSHEHYVIGVVEVGVQAYSYRGARYMLDHNWTMILRRIFPLPETSEGAQYPN